MAALEAAEAKARFSPGGGLAVPTAEDFSTQVASVASGLGNNQQRQEKDDEGPTGQGETFVPGGWTPPSAAPEPSAPPPPPPQEAEAGPTGQGESFVPGEWRPPGS